MAYTFSNFLDDLQPVGVGIQNVVGNEQKMTAGIFNGLFSTVGGLGNNIQSLGSSLSLPLLVLGGGVLLFMLKK
jgi:hypothetical protein